MNRKIKLETSKVIKALIYGDPGSTKTRTACSAALDSRMGPVLYLNAAGNPISVREYSVLPDMIEMSRLNDFNAPYDWLSKGQPKNHAFAREFELQYGDAEPYRTVIVDQLTDVQRMSFTEVLGAQATGPGSFPVKREWDHYNKVLYQMTNFAKLYFSLPLNVIMTALEQSREEEDTGIVKYYPSLEGRSMHEVPGYAVLVARLVAAKSLSNLQLKVVADSNNKQPPKDSVAFFKPTGKFIAKNQYGGSLADFMPDPTMTKIYDCIWGPEL